LKFILFVAIICQQSNPTLFFLFSQTIIMPSQPQHDTAQSQENPGEPQESESAPQLNELGHDKLDRFMTN
jgi:hypothetical protein